MAIALTVQIPDDIYEPLRQRAAQAGRMPEQMVSEWIEDLVKRLAKDDRLLQLAGAFESEVADVSSRHDDYIGQSLRNADERSVR